jgi:iron(III) transport system permease protein
VAARVVGLLARRYQRAIVLTLAALLLAVFTLVPLAAPLSELLTGDADIPALLGSARLARLLARSLSLAASVTALSLLIGVPFGALLGRTDILGRRLAWILHAFPMFLPPFLLALGWFHLFGRQGLLGSEASTKMLFGWPGVLIVLSLSFAPIVTTLTALGLASVDASLEEAARVVARPWHVMTRVLLPSAWPAIALAAIIVFSLSLSELGVPMFLRVDVYPAAIFARLGGIDYAPGEAFGLALPLLAIGLCLVLLERRTRGGRSFAVIGLRSEPRPPLPVGRLRVPLSIACWAVTALSLLPIAALTWRAAAGGGFGALSQWVGASPWNSLLVAGAAATLIVALALVIGHAAARGIRGASWLDAIAPPC